MVAKYIKFILVKIILVIFASVGAFLVAFLLSMTMSDATDASFRAITTCVIPTVVFFAFIYSFESKIRLPDDAVLSAKYFIMFALREASVYAIFALPLTIVVAVAGSGILDGGVASCFLLPHFAFVRCDLPLAANYVLFCAVYAIVSFTAHYMQSKKPTPAAEPVTDTNDEPGEDGEPLE